MDSTASCYETASCYDVLHIPSSASEYDIHDSFYRLIALWRGTPHAIVIFQAYTLALELLQFK